MPSLQVDTVTRSCFLFVSAQSSLVLKIVRRCSWVTSLAHLQAAWCGGNAEASNMGYLNGAHQIKIKGSVTHVAAR